MAQKESTVKKSGRMGRPTPDELKVGKTAGVTFELEDLDWLRTQPHSLSYQVREAVRLYRKTIEQQQVG